MNAESKEKFSRQRGNTSEEISWRGDQRLLSIADRIKKPLKEDTKSNEGASAIVYPNSMERQFKSINIKLH